MYFKKINKQKSLIVFSLKTKVNQQNMNISYKQGRIHGQYQSRTGGQGRKRWFFHFSTRAHRRTDRRTDRPTNGRTDKASYRVACPQLKKEEEARGEMEN